MRQVGNLQTAGRVLQAARGTLGGEGLTACTRESKFFQTPRLPGTKGHGGRNRRRVAGGRAAGPAGPKPLQRGI
jgi:hypothetical protein